MPKFAADQQPSRVRSIQPPGPTAAGRGGSARGRAEALHLPQSPENGTVWGTAERVDLRASHAAVPVRGAWLPSPRGLRPQRAEQREGSHPGVPSHSGAMQTRGGTGNVTAAVSLVARPGDGTWWSAEAAHPRGGQGPAGTRPGQGTHRHEARSASSGSPPLERRSGKARAPPALVVTAGSHHRADRKHVRACDRLLKGQKAMGVEEVTTSMDAEELETHLQDGAARLQRMGSRPPPQRRGSSPKPGSAPGRARGLSSVADKIVEVATKRVVAPRCAALVEEGSDGDRPERSPHQCLDAWGRTIQPQRVPHLVEAAMRGVGTAVDPPWVRKVLRPRGGGNRGLRLLSRRRNAGRMEEGRRETTEVGTPQGSRRAPLLSNVSRQDVLDIGLQRRVRRHGRGPALVGRCADEGLAGFQARTDAAAFGDRLRERLAGFPLELAEEHTRHREWGRYARATADQRGEKPQAGTGLGRPVLWGKTRQGACKGTRQTSRKQRQQSRARLTDWRRRDRPLLPPGERLRQAQGRGQGHRNSSAMTDNADRCQRSMPLTRRALCQWLPRRSQRPASPWHGFFPALRPGGWPQVRVRVNWNPFASLHDCTQSRRGQSHVSGSVRGEGTTGV